MPHRFLQLLPIVSASLVCLAVGFLAGAMFVQSSRRPPTVIRSDTRPTVPVVTVEGVEDGFVVGNVRGTARVILGKSLIEAGSGGSFRIAAGSLALDLAGRPPPGARFVASKKGKKYYPIGSPSAEKLSPANRLYFATDIEAQNAGYRQ